MDVHCNNLKRLCRLCKLLLTKNSYDVSKYQSKILATLFYDVSEDQEGIHPNLFCNRCYTKMTNIEHRKTSKSDSPPVWKLHNEVECDTCTSISVLKKGGHKPKKKSSGRRKADLQIWTRKDIEKLIFSYNLPSHLPITTTPKIPIEKFSIARNPQLDMCKCDVCHHIISQPVMAAKCQHVYCYKCLVPNLLGKSVENGKCPKCDVVISLDGLIPSTHINNLLSLLVVECEQCKKVFGYDKYNELTEHESNCIPEPAPYLLTDVFNLNEYSSISRVHEDACLHILKQKMKQADSTTCKFISGGPRPTIVQVTPVAYKKSENVTTKTLRTRTAQMKSTMEVVTGGSKESMVLQTGQLVKLFNVKERVSILDAAKITRSHIDAESLVAMKADLGMPWEKMKAMSRWLTMFKISTDSNAKQRIVAREWSGDSFTVEEAPFTVSIKDRKGQYKISSAPLAYIADFPSHVLNLLDTLDENGILLFLNDSDDIHIKIGGDHGGDSFKMVFQVVNMKNPNSKENSMVFVMFEAKDYRSNLEIALGQYKQQIDELQLMKWKNRSIKVFMFGDYQFLCCVYGLTGANGRHCCIYCTATKENIQLGIADSAPRSLDSMMNDLQKFQDDGSNLKNAKFYNNIVYSPMFNIPLLQLCPPGLHISLGTYLNFFNLLEDEAHQLDLKIAEKKGELINSVFSNIRTQIKNLCVSIEDKEQKIGLVRDAVANAILLHPENEQEIKDVYQPRLKFLADQINIKNDEIENLKKSDDYKEPGACEKKLDDVLKELTVKRQAYHGKSFVGNHVHKMLKPASIEKLCSAITDVVSQLDLNDTEIVDMARELSNRFHHLFTKYALCHNRFNSCDYFEDDDIQTLQNAIADLMYFFRENWPSESITPKLHMLEKHVVPFIKKWRYAMGLYGEQGGEGIHPEFNNLTRIYCRMRSSTQRVGSMIKEHGIRTHPLAKKLRPVVRKRKFKNKNDLNS